MTQTAEGALGEVEDILQRMRELQFRAVTAPLNASDQSTNSNLNSISLLLKLTKLQDKTNLTMLIF